MNPGYAGRTELPESVKALFRPVTCIKPDLELICLISLFSDGFLTAKVSNNIRTNIMSLDLIICFNNTTLRQTKSL